MLTTTTEPFVCFPLAALELVRCLHDGGKLRGEDAEESRVRRGSARCETCGARYAIEDGVLELLAHQQVSATAQDEIVARNAQAADYDDFFTDAQNEMELPSLLAELDLRDGQRILEIGAGTGRVTGALLRRSELVLAVDFSRESLAVLANRCGREQGLALACADATTLRLSPGGFDRIVATQVIEHIPTLAGRLALYHGLSAALARDGLFVGTAYHFGVRHWSTGREGFHRSGIYFRRFTVGDLRHELASHFEQVNVRPINVRPLLAERVGLPAGPISRGLERIPLISLFGDLLLASARRRRTVA